MCNVITARLLCRCSCFSVGASVFFLIRHYDICLSATQTSHTVSDGACSSFTLLLSPLVFMFSSPAGSISLLILLGNLFHSRVSEMSSWLRKENERGTRYRESAESPLWQNNLYTLTSPFIYLKVSALTVCWIAVPVLISSAYSMTAECVACCRWLPLGLYLFWLLRLDAECL